MRKTNTIKSLVVVGACVLLILSLVHVFNPINKQRLKLAAEPKLDFFTPILERSILSPSLQGTYEYSRAMQVFAGSEDILTKEYLASRVHVPEVTVDELRRSHRSYINYLKSESNTADTFAYVSKGTVEWDHYKDSKGYLYIGGGQYSWLSLLSIKQLRKTGATLPVELFIPTIEDYEHHFCEIILPQYNARCVVFTGPTSQQYPFEPKGYQYKMLALLESTFENVLYMDSDLYPLKNVDYLFDTDVYRKNGLVLWPDAWARTTSPIFYEIAEIEVLENKIRHSFNELARLKDNKPVMPLRDGDFSNSNFHDFENTIPNPTVEAGVILINKTSHVRTLQLALYYNIFGPDFYYPLLTQGGAGEGDKDTFNAAAHVLNEPYFLTPKSFSWVGYHSKETSQHTSKALGIHDPSDISEKDSFIFLHCSYPKLYPNNMISELKYDSLDEHIRMYSAIYDQAGYDVDLRLLDLFTEGFCENYYPEGVHPETYHNTHWAAPFNTFIMAKSSALAGSCEHIFIPHLEWLRSSTKFPDTNKGFSYPEAFSAPEVSA